MVIEQGENKKKMRDSAGTMNNILDGAIDCFSQKNYDAAAFREIAKSAHTDVALINRYFGAKENLYAEALKKASEAIDLKGVIDNTPLNELGHALSHIIFENHNQKYIKLYLRAVSSEQTESAYIHIIQENFCKPLADKLNGPDAAIRAEFIYSEVSGMAIAYHLLQLTAITSMEKDDLEQRLAVEIQKRIDE